MSESEDVLLLLKELVNRVRELERVAYNNDNLLMKSGFVVADSPTPKMDNKVASTYSMDDISKMSFDDMAGIIKKMEGN